MAKFRDNIETGSGGQFLRLKDKESQYVIFLGDPCEFYCVWDKAKYLAVPEGTPKAKFRFRINAVVKEADGSFIPKIFENGATVYNMLKTLNEEYGGLETVIVKITRKGASMNDTEYILMPIRQEISPQTKAILAKIKLLDLEPELPKEASSAEAYFDAPPQEFNQQHDELPF